jgi:hypothetical protein
MYEPNTYQKLPDFEWQYRTTYNNNFNNQLLAGHNAGLALYDYETDTKLYKNLDLKAIDTDKINFSEINKQLDVNFHNRNAYEEAHQTAKGAVEGLVNTINENVGDPVEKAINRLIEYIKSLFTIDKETLYYIGGSALLIFIILKKV